MKKVFKVLAIFALVAVIGFSFACSGGGGGGGDDGGTPGGGSDGGGNGDGGGAGGGGSGGGGGTQNAPRITTSSLPDGTKGTEYSQTLTATGSAPITWSVSSGSLPTGLRLAEETGIISGTPTMATGTNVSFSVKATNAKGSDTKYLSIKIIGTYLDFTYTETENAVTITKYNGAGGSVTIPSTIEGKQVTKIGDGAFWGCTSLTGVTIPNSVTSIDSAAFRNCTNLTSVTLSDRLTSIWSFVFYSCTNLTSVTIPDSVTMILNNAFAYSGLTSITIPKNVTSIDEGAFSGCKSLTAINVDTVNTTYISQDDALYNKAKTTLFVYPAGKTGTYNIPSTVTSIAESAFAGSSLTGVTIPDSVTSLGKNAFEGSSLTSVTIGNGVTSIGVSAFSRCRKLTSVTIGNSVTSIGGSAFLYCGLTNVTIPNSVTSIGVSAFSGCSELTSVTIGNGVTSIGESAFSSCSGLISVTFATGSNISDANFGSSAFPENNGNGGNRLKNAYSTGKAGTYTRTENSYNWSKQK